MKETKTFTDLNFKNHSVHNALQGIIVLPNDITVSVVTMINGSGLYGRLNELTFEVGAFDKHNDFIKLQEWDDVLPWQTIDEINTIIAKLELSSYRFIGTSLSFCIRDMVKKEDTQHFGVINPDEVWCIESSTHYENQEQFECVIESYRSSYWRETPNECEELARKFEKEERITQKRLNDENPEACNTPRGGYWKTL